MLKKLIMKVAVVEERPGYLVAGLVGCGNLLATCDAETGSSEEALARCADLAAALRAADAAFGAETPRPVPQPPMETPR